MNSDSMEKATKFVLIPFRDFRLLTCKRKISSKGRISGIVKQIDLSSEEDEAPVTKSIKRLRFIKDFSDKFLDPPKKQAPITRARLKNLSPRNAKQFLERSEVNQNLKSKNPNRKSNRIKMTIPKIKTTEAKTQMNQKKPIEVSEKEFFTDLSYPSGFPVSLIDQINLFKHILGTFQIFYSNTKLHLYTKIFKRILIVDNG